MKCFKALFIEWNGIDSSQGNKVGEKRITRGGDKGQGGQGTRGKGQGTEEMRKTWERG